LHVIESGLEVLESIETLAGRIGLSVKMGELRIEHRPATQEECQALNLTEGTSILVVSRTIQAEDRPVAYLVDILPEDVLALEAVQNGFTGSVLDVLLRRGSPAPAYSRTEINAVTATADIARSMGIQRGDVLLRFIAYLYAEDGRVVDYSYSYFLPGYFNFHVVRRVERESGLG
jgi:GntR family transcriptional regulator